ncbi:MAG: hypothetical protein OSA45_03795 [Halioglobus sp.]|jgi:hypothetical protein|nr:hypothetical protein [Halioglobus sp.]
MKSIFLAFLSVSLIVFIVAEVNARGRGGGGHHARSHARSNVNSGHHGNRGQVNRNNVNRHGNVNINSNRDVNVNVNNRGYHHGCCYHDNYHPLAVAAAVTATAIVVGSMVNSLPPSCQTVIVSGFAYQQCGNTWYQPQMSGSSTTYIVVNAP